jgi:hypothetical protein
MIDPITDEYREIMDHLPELIYKKRELGRFHIRPTAVIIPARLNKPYKGEDADPTFSGTMMGLPIVWSEQEIWGVLT